MPTRKTIAIVEDNKDNRLLLRSILRDHYHIIEYSSSFEALDGIKKKIPDLIILDISLPGMDGRELLSHLKRSHRRLANVPVIALTAYAMTGDRESYLSSGFDDYVAKPIVDEDSFLLAIERLFAKSNK